MFGYENGKKIASLGFLLWILQIALNIAAFFLLRMLGLSEKIYSLLSLVSWVALALVAFGFLAMWTARKEFLDFAIAGAAAGAVIVPLFLSFILKFPVVFSSLLTALIWAAFYFGLALRTKRKNSMLALLLCGIAFFQVLSMFLPAVTGGVPADGYAMNFVSLISLVVKLGGAGLGFLSTRMN